MTVTRGFTEEADKLLDYLEHGIFDALQKQYLRSFIFAIYLDNQDPNNIVEAYTFNFKVCSCASCYLRNTEMIRPQYYTLPGTDTVVPVMSLDADLEKLSLTKTKKVADPVADAMKNGRVPTLGEVKRSLKNSSADIGITPERRFATFKLFYQDHTPDDYEPKHFRSGDVKKDKWFFTTHDKGEVPERCSVGSLETGYHGVNVRVTSVSAYLPSAEDNNAPFLGTTSGHAHAAPILSPAEEAALRNQQTQIQRQDAIDRRVVWDADDGLGDADADGEDDPDVTSGENASFYLGSWRVHDSGVEFVMPIGIRDDEGNIKPFSKEERQERAVSRAEEAQYTGKQDSVPSHVAQLAQAERHPAEAIMRTQQLDHTQVIETPLSALSRRPSPSPSRSPSPTPKQSKRGTSGRIPSAGPSLPPSDLDAQSFSSLSSLADGIQSIDTQMVKDLIANAAATEIEDTEMLDMETQVVPQASAENDSIQSFSNIAGTQRSPHIRPPRSTADKERSDAEDDSSLDCECGVTNEDNDCCMCEGGCKRWFHIWCMGFHSAQDERIPAVFVCFDCRVRADKNWDLIMVHDLYPRMLARFRDLAIFRRAIKIFEMYNPENLSSFTKLMDCDSVVAGQLFKRLETEGFIAKETIEVDDLGLMETSTRTAKGKQKGKAGAKTRQSQRRKTMQKPKYVFVRATTKGQAYDDYFNPDPEVEKRLLGLSNLKPARRSHKKRVVEDMDVEMDVPLSQPRLVDVDINMAVDSNTDGLPTILAESQTQAETQQIDAHGEGEGGQIRRKTTRTFSQEVPRTSKKIKMSVGPAVDLGD
uniref:Meiosis-specific protein hop1 n=1 Tax=Sparassis latifolia TaxID=1202976 RepID=A0A6B9LTF5_9APHY|nr:meiosis-specific protein hop1 [Sparassis latifolia]